MAQDVIMPKLAMGMSEGTIIEWKVPQGGALEKGQILLEIETEKVTYEIEATASGFVNILVPVSKTVPTYHVIGQIADSLEEFAEGCKTQVVAPEATPAAAVVQEAVSGGGRINASPVAKKMAAEKGIDLFTLSGSGPKGKIGKKDVLAAIAARDVVAEQVQTESTQPTAQSVAVAGARKVRATIPLRGLRKTIADNMMQSLAATAQLTCTVEYDTGELMGLRKSLLSCEPQLGFRVSYLDLMTMIVARVAQQVPIINSSIVDGEIRVWEDVNIGIAVATEISEYESGLFVPVIRDVGRKTLGQIGSEIRQLAEDARNGKLTPEQMSGGTLTISSGSMGSGMVMATPIMSKGQAMLVQPGLIEERPVVRDGAIVVRPIMRVNYTWDHRIIDGVPFAKFSEAMRALLESPGNLIL